MALTQKPQRTTPLLFAAGAGGDLLYKTELPGLPQMADPRALRTCLALMDQAAVNGGSACHWGGPSALAEILSALHAQIFSRDPAQWTQRLNLVNDIGHAHNAFYALFALYQMIPLQDLNGFRSLGSKLTGHGEAHLFPEGVLLSNGPLGSTVPQAQGLAIGDKLAGRERKTLCLVSDGAMMEGEVKEALASIPGLSAKGKLNPFILVISDNNTKLSGRIDQDSFCMSPTMNTLEGLGWEVLTLDGHDLKACAELFGNLLQRQTSEFSKPVAVLAKTIKGHGIKSTAESSSGGHGYPLKAYDEKLISFLEELWSPAAVPSDFISWAQSLIQKPASSGAGAKSSVPTNKVQAGFGKAAVAAKEKGLPVVSVTSDLPGSTGIAPFRKAYPNDSFDVGIAESNMVSVAAGLSKAGFIPIVDTFAAFGVTKGNLPLIMSSLSQAPLIALYTHTGFQDAADGASHQSLTYASALGSIPQVELVAPATTHEAEELLSYALTRQHQSWQKNEVCPSTVFFAGRENFVESLADTSIKETAWGTPRKLCEGTDPLVLISYGPLVHECLRAQQILQEQHGRSVSVVNHLFLNHWDKSFYADLPKGSKVLFVEDHQKLGGVGSWLAADLSESLGGEQLKQFVHLGVKGEFGQSAYSAGELYAQHGLDAQAIVKRALSMLA